MGALYWVVSGVLREPLRLGRLVVGSVFLGLAVGSRPHYVFAVIVPLVLWIEWLRRQRGDHPREVAGATLALFGPFLACVGLLGVYNFARFGSFTEFGSRYQLAGAYMLGYQFFEPSRVLPGLYRYLWEPAQLSPSFPFWHAVYFGSYGSVEAIAGLLPNIPFVNILWVAPWLISRRREPPGSYVAVLVEVFTLLGLSLVVFLSWVFPPTMRYELDFVGLLLLAAALVWFWLHREWAGRKPVSVLLACIGVGSIAYGCLFNLAISMTGYFDWFKLYNPASYRRIEKVFEPLEQALRGIL